MDQPAWQCNRILVADDDTIYVFDIKDPEWSAKIERAALHLGKLANVAFGHTANDILVFSDFGIKLTIWSLITSRGVEIRDPKYLTRCYSLRPHTGHMALLIRPATQDILMLLNPADHSLAKSVDLPTVDAQAVVWSTHGRWLAIRDAASIGYKTLIYTADGNLYKTYVQHESGDDVALGIKSFEWNPAGLLAIGDYNSNVTILGKDTVYMPRSTVHEPEL